MLGIAHFGLNYNTKKVNFEKFRSVALEGLKVAPEFFVRIIPTIAASFFSVSKLNLKRNNIRALHQGILFIFHFKVCYGHRSLHFDHLLMKLLYQPTFPFSILLFVTRELTPSYT